MALGNFVAGRFRATYASPASAPQGVLAAAYLGLVEKGWTISFGYGKELISDSDEYGAAVIDAVFRGITNCFMQTTMIEWLASTLNLLTPYGTTALPQTGAGSLNTGPVGLLDSNVGGQMVLTSTAGTPAAISPATATFPSIVIADNFDISTLYGPYLRKLPIRMRIYPTAASAGAVAISYLTVT